MRVLVITGAGVSAESGIPTFRGKDGYWRNLDPMKLATPEAFAEHPKLVWEWYNERRLRIRSARPNPAHEAIARLATVADEFLLLTQNVDDLHFRAGLPMEKMVQIHGDIFETRCSRCDGSDVDETEDLVRLKRTSFQSVSEAALPSCAKCHTLMRPGVVWFGEQLDPRKIGIVEKFLERGPCDYVIVVGTTALFGYIVDWAVRATASRGELIEVNPEETALSQFATRLLREPAAIALPRIVGEIAESAL